MEDSFEKKLLEVDLLDIYDDIASIEISKIDLIQLCLDFPCSVDLKAGNIVYAVEEKYKHKLSNYKKSKRLKWLSRNLKSIIPNPEEKYLKWQQKHHTNKKYEWMKRKLLALDYFSNDPLLFCSEEPCCSKSLVNAPKRRLSHLNESRRISTCETTSSTVGNTSTESVAVTVIPSQRTTTTQDYLSEEADTGGLFNFRNVSMSSSYNTTEDLPSLVIEGDIPENETPVDSSEVAVTAKKPAKVWRRSVLPSLIHESNPISSQETEYVSFYQDMHVTSTQEFG